MFLRFEYIKSIMNKVNGTKWVVLKCDNCNKTIKKRFAKATDYKIYRKLSKKERNKYIPPARFCSNSCRRKYFKNLKCRVVGCKRPYHGKGLCRNHREMERRHGDPLGNVCKYCSNLFYQGRKYLKRLKILPRCCAKCFRIEIRKLVFKKYGNKCNCCGEKEIRFLQLDHIKGGGRKDYLTREREFIYEEALIFKKNYQVLCVNCNLGRYLNGGICPHKTG